MRKLMFVLLSTLLLTACGNPKNPKDLTELKSQMDNAATEAQKALLAHVSSAIEKGGTEYAVDFCNLKALAITDSLSEQYGYSISRITDRNRNPENGLETETERLIFEQFKENNELTDSLLIVNNQLHFYKRINAGMPACIKCHGKPETDIESGTLTKIKSLYPADLATGYALNDFRGLWKIIKEQNND